MRKQGNIGSAGSPDGIPTREQHSSAATAEDDATGMPWRSCSLDGGTDNRSYSDSKLVDAHSLDDNSGSSSDSDGSGDDDDSQAAPPRRGSHPIPISASATNRVNDKGPSFSFGGTKGVFDVLREKMSLRTSPSKQNGGVSPDGRTSSSALNGGRAGRSRSISSAHLPGSPTARIHTKPQRPSTTVPPPSPPPQSPSLCVRRSPGELSLHHQTVASKMKPLVVANKKVLKQLLVPDRPGTHCSVTAYSRS
jgi:hypothetical protein